jgi:hypothetical protein
MIFDLNNQYEIPKYKEYVNKLYNEKAVVEVRKKMPHRSLPQNRYFYLLLGWFAAETGYSVDEVKLDIFKKLVNKDLFVVEAKNRRGDIVKTVKSSASLSTAEMTLAIERFRDYSAAEAGIYLPAPNEREFLLSIQKELERNKEYI